jgi:ABC-type Fe3+ transport system permease subunit
MGRKLTKNPLYTTLYWLFFLSIIFPVLYTFTKALIFDSSSSNILSQLNLNLFILLVKSVLIAVIIAVFSTFFGAIIGFILYKTKVKYSLFFKIALLIPLFISPFILAVAWKDFFALFIDSKHLSHSIFGMIWVLISIYTPLSLLIIGSAFSNINAPIEEAGLLITPSFKVILKITLPLIKPALMSSFVLVFIFSISEFTVPAFFNVRVFTTEIFTQFSAFYKHSLAILQSLFLVLICLALLYTDRKQLANSSFLSFGSKGVKTHYFDFKSKNKISQNILLFWWFTSVLFPLLILFYQSFSNNGYLYFIQAFKLLLPTFKDSILLALSGALIAVFIGFVVAYKTHKQKVKSKLSISFDWFLLLVFAIPSGVFGISLIKFYNQNGLQFIYTSLVIIIIAYVGKFSFIASKLIANALKQVPDSLEEMAQIQGISSFKTILFIVVPIIVPSLFMAFLSVFIFSLGELGTSIMLYPPGVKLTSIKIYTLMANAPQALTAGMVLISFLMSLLSIFILYLMTKPFLVTVKQTSLT